MLLMLVCGAAGPCHTSVAEDHFGDFITCERVALQDVTRLRQDGWRPVTVVCGTEDGEPLPATAPLPGHKPEAQP